MKKLLLLLGALVVTGGIPLAAKAQEIPCKDGPCVRKRRPGTHFIAELNGGGSLNRDGGLALDALVGAGGKLPGFPPRFYFVAEFSYNTSTESGRLTSVPGNYRDERDYKDITFGLRTYLPIWGPVRVFADLLGGASNQSVILERDHHVTRQASDWSGLLAVGAGFQFRLMHHLSIGLRTKVVLTPHDVGGLHQATGSNAPYRTSLTGGVTWHF